MSLKPDMSVMVGLSTAALVYAVYANATPSVTEIRAAKPMDSDVEASRKLATWTAAGAVGGISLITRDATVFIIGGTMVVALDWWHRHANTVDPRAGKAAVMNMGSGTLPVATQQNDDAGFGYSDDIPVYS